MPAPELKLDPLFTDQFFQLPPKTDERPIILGFPVPATAKEVPAFMKVQGKAASKSHEEKPSSRGTTWFLGFSALLDKLHDWCEENLSKEKYGLGKPYDLGAMISVMRNHLEYSSDKEENNEFYLSFFNRGPFSLAKLLRYLVSDNFTLDYKQLVMDQFFEELSVNNVCAPGCVLNLDYACQLFSSSLPEHMRLYRKETAEQVSAKLMLKYEKITVYKAFQRHFASTASLFYSQLAIADEEKFDTVCHAVVNLINSGKELTPEFQTKDEYALMAKILKDEFPESFAKTLKPEGLVDFLFQVPIILKKSEIEKAKQNQEEQKEEKEQKEQAKSAPGIEQEKREQITLQKTLDALYAEAKRDPEFSAKRKNFQMEWLGLNLKYFGLDEDFSEELIFSNNFDFLAISDSNSNAKDVKITYTLNSRESIQRAIITSVLHRLSYLRYITLTPAEKVMRGGGECYLFKSNNLSLSFVKDPVTKVRLPLFDYIYPALLLETEEACYAKLVEEAKFLSESQTVDLLKLILASLFHEEKVETHHQALWKGLVKFVSVNAAYLPKLVSDDYPITLLHVPAKWGLLDFFKDVTNADLLFSVHTFGAIYGALEKLQWEVVNFFLDRFYQGKIKVTLSSLILSTAMEHQQTYIIRRYFQFTDLLHPVPEEKEDKPNLLAAIQQEKNIQVVKARLLKSVAKDNPNNRVFIRALIELAVGKKDAPLAVKKMLEMLSSEQLAVLVKLILPDGNPFLQYCFMQSDVVVMDFFKIMKEEVRKIIPLPEGMVPSLLKFKKPLDHLICLLGFYENFTVFCILNKIPASLHEKSLIFAALSSFSSKSDQRKEYVWKTVIPNLLSLNDHALLTKLIKEGHVLSEDCNDVSLLYEKIKQTDAWDCFKVFYKEMPGFFEVEDTLPFEAARANRFDVSQEIYASNPNAMDAICLFYRGATKQQVESKRDDSVSKMLLLDLCKLQSEEDYTDWKGLIFILLQRMVDQINTLIFVEFKSKQAEPNEGQSVDAGNQFILDYLFREELLALIFPHLSKETIESAHFLDFMRRKMQDEATESIAYAAILQNPKILDHLFSPKGFLNTPYYMKGLLEALAEMEDGMVMPPAALSVIELHNQFSYVESPPYDVVAKIFQKCLYVSVVEDPKDDKLVKELLNPKSSHLLFKEKLPHQLKALLSFEQENFALLFKTMFILLTQVSGSDAPAFLRKFNARCYDAFISYLLNMRTSIRLELFNAKNEGLLMLVLHKASASTINLFLSDQQVRKKLPTLLETLQEPDVFLRVYVYHMFLVDLADPVFRQQLDTILKSRELTFPLLDYAISLHDSTLQAYNDNSAIVEQLIRGSLTANANNPDALRTLGSSFLQRLVDEQDRAGVAPDSLLLLWAEVEFTLEKLINPNMHSEPSVRLVLVVNRIKKFPDLSASFKFDVANFLWKHYPNFGGMQLLACRLMIEVGVENNREAESKLQLWLGSLLNKELKATDIDTAYPEAVKLLLNAHFIRDFDAKVKTISDCLVSEPSPSTTVPTSSIFAGARVQSPGVFPAFLALRKIYKKLLETAEGEVEKKIILYTLTSETNPKIKQFMVTIQNALNVKPTESCHKIFEQSLKHQLGKEEWQKVKERVVGRLHRAIGEATAEKPLNFNEEMDFLRAMLEGLKTGVLPAVSSEEDPVLQQEESRSTARFPIGFV